MTQVVVIIRIFQQALIMACDPDLETDCDDSGCL